MINFTHIKEEIYNYLFPFIRLIKKIIILSGEKELNLHYSKVIDNIKHRKDSTIRFAAYVMYDTDYGFDSVFQLMLKNSDVWEPMLVVIPDMLRGDEYKRGLYLRTRNFLISKYGKDKVLDGWDLDEEYYDLLDDFDVVYYNNPYDSMAHTFHKIVYAKNKSVLPIYITYGYEVSRFYTRLRQAEYGINTVWRCYTDTVYSYEDYCKFECVKGRNVKLVGYTKMDNLYSLLKTKKLSENKTILITPHHTVSDKRLPLSNFLKFNEFYLNLPHIYPNIKFIFRPHPLLFTNLINLGIWDKKQVDDYIFQMKKNGIEYSDGGDYFELFYKADAIINDSASFIVEWLFTGKPGCFVWNPKFKESCVTTLAQKALSKYQIVHDEKEIISFIDSVLDSHSTVSMDDWVREKIAINYPNAALSVYNDLTSELMNSN